MSRPRLSTSLGGMAASISAGEASGPASVFDSRTDSSKPAIIARSARVWAAVVINDERRRHFAGDSEGTMTNPRSARQRRPIRCAFCSHFLAALSQASQSHSGFRRLVN
jgi:hypothetical protein